MINRLRQNNDGQWRTSQQFINKPKSPQKVQEDYNHSYIPIRGQENQFSARNTFQPNQPQAQNNKGKPLISPRRMNPNPNPLSQRNPNPISHHNPNSFSHHSSNPNDRNCLNHPAKRAEFMSGEGDGEYYCGRCAAQLATRGCEVIRLQAAGLRVSKRNQLPHYPQYEHDPLYQQIMDILRLCNSSINQHSSNMDRFAGLQQQYQQQMDLTSAFYDRLIQIIQQMKSDHLYDLVQQRDKYTQIADIQNDHLRQNIIQINVIKNDIENHLEEVLEGIRQSGNAEQCRESLDHYRQKLTLFGHQLEEQLESLQGVTRYPQNKIDAMLLDFEDFLKILWDNPAETQQRPQQSQFPPQQNANMNSALTVKNIHQILPRGVNEQQGRRAFRNLEQEEQDEVQQSFQERKSPNFKKI